MRKILVPELESVPALPKARPETGDEYFQRVQRGIDQGQWRGVQSCDERPERANVRDLEGK